MPSENVLEQLNVIKRGTEEIFSEEELVAKLEASEKTGKPLRVKLGIDPTAPDIHLGFAVVLRKLRQFQDLGHIVCLIVGDFTAMIGDPSGKSKTRPMLTREEVIANAKTYEKQLYQILDETKTELYFNADWLNKMNFADVIRLTSHYTVAQILKREDFANRLDNGLPLGMHEILYPLCQGYDSVEIKSDIEMGGTDQTFNNLVGRELQRAFGQEPQVVITMPLLEGVDGVEKMSKSLGNYIGINESPKEIFGKTLSIPDELIYRYFLLCTDVPTEELDAIKEKVKENPLKQKRRLARELVKEYYDEDAAKKAQEEFDNVFRQGGVPDDIPVFELNGEKDYWICKLMVDLEFAKSNGQARRLIKQGAVSIDGEKVTNANLDLSPENEFILKVGKRRFAKVIP